MRNFSILSKDFHSFSSLNYRLELGVVRSKAVRRETKGGRVAFFLFFSFLLLFECLETNKNFGGNRGSIRDIWRQSRLYDRSRRKTAIASICRGCYGLEESIGGPIVCVAPIVSSNEINGRRGKKLIRWVAEIGENKIFSRFLSLPSNHSKKKSHVESFPKSGISTLHLLSLSPFPFFYPPHPKKKKAAETSLKMLVGDYSIEIARHWPRLWIL